MKYILSLLLLLWTTLPSISEELPPVPEGGINYFLQGPCKDNESGLKGYCFMGKTNDGRTILTFWQDDELMFIRQVVGDGYETI